MSSGRSMSREERPAPLVPQFYEGRSVFITGGTGFMGKVLVERLLWTCPEVGPVYLLMRQKRGATPYERLAQLKHSQVFDVIRSHCPERLNRLHAVPGDTTLPRLGMDSQTLQMLKHVSVVFHNAATVKFDEPLGRALQHNVHSILALMQLANSLPELQVLVHVSTGYCNAELPKVEERVYPPPMPLQRLLALVDSTPPDELKQLTPNLIKPKPNTYAFTKAMAESAVQQLRARVHYPVAIFRPTIVISSNRYPFPGWTENLNGPSGTLVGIGKGLLHTFICREEARADMLPVDCAIDTLLAIAWETATDRPSDVRVYNCSSCENPTTWYQFRRALFTYLERFPVRGAVWHPFIIIVNNRHVYRMLELVLQTVPLHLAQFVTRLSLFKTPYNFITMGRRLRAMTETMSFFATREWWFETGNVQRMRDRLTHTDRHIYNLDISTIDWEEHYSNFVKGTKKYTLQENDDSIPAAKLRMERLQMLHYSVLMILLFLLYKGLMFFVVFFLSRAISL